MGFKHETIEKNSMILLICTLIVVAIGGLVEIVPLYWVKSTIEPVEGMRPYTPLELAGRNIYVREGCYNCHSQMIRSLRSEVERYGPYSLASESLWDHPFQWGSKRTGPDLARAGGRYSDEWHMAHLVNPRDVVPASIMPGYPFLAGALLDLKELPLQMKAQAMEGVPYTKDMIEHAEADTLAQADPEANGKPLAGRYGKKVNVRDFDGNPRAVTEMDALIAYLQMLGTLVDFKAFDKTAPENRR